MHLGVVLKSLYVSSPSETITTTRRPADNLDIPTSILPSSRAVTARFGKRLDRLRSNRERQTLWASPAACVVPKQRRRWRSGRITRRKNFSAASFSESRCDQSARQLSKKHRQPDRRFQTVRSLTSARKSIFNSESAKLQIGHRVRGVQTETSIEHRVESTLLFLPIRLWVKGIRGQGG